MTFSHLTPAHEPSLFAVEVERQRLDVLLQAWAEKDMGLCQNE